MTDTAADPLVGMVLGGTYRVTARLGAGGMGSVYAATHTRLPTQFAVKVLHDRVEASSQEFQRFRREAEVCCRLRHPNIVEVVDFNVTPEGRPYIVEEFLHGEDLAARIQRLGRLDPAATIRILRQVCLALSVAHESGVVHRDLKPQNIYLCQQGSRNDHVKLLDFGISKIQGSRQGLTQAHTLLGTPHYMSPEQANADHENLDHRTDLFALGVIAYEMLSGQVPFRGDNLAQIALAILLQLPQPLSELVPGLPPGLEAAVMRALEKQPRDRFASAAEFAAALPRSGAAPGSPDADLDEPDPGAGRGPAAVSALAPTQAVPVVSAVSATTLSAAAAEVREDREAGAPRGSRGRTGALVAAAVGLLVLGGVATWWMLGRDDRTPGSGRPTAPGSTPARPLGADAAGLPASPARVNVQLAGLPAEARCTVDGAPFTDNPLLLPRQAGMVTVRCEVPGKHPFVRRITPDRDQTLPVELVAVTPAGAPTMAAEPARPAARPPAEGQRPRPGSLCRQKLVDLKKLRLSGSISQEEYLRNVDRIMAKYCRDRN